MFQAELVIRYVEMIRFEALLVWLTFSADVASAPAGIDEFPGAVVDFDDVPGVIGGEWWHCGSGRERRVSVTFPMAGDDDRLEASVCCECGEETSITFTNCKSGGKGAGGCRRLNAVVEESVDVIADVVV